VTRMTPAVWDSWPTEKAPVEAQVKAPVRRSETELANLQLFSAN